MNKYYLFFLTVGMCIFTIAGFSQRFPVHNSLKYLNLTGEVKSVTTYKQKFTKEGKKKKVNADSASFASRMELDLMGLPVLMQYSRGMDLIEDVNTYDPDGNLIRQDYTGDYSNDFSLFSYDTINNIVDMYVFGTPTFNSDTIAQRVEQYDENMNLVHYEMLMCPNNEWRHWEVRLIEYDSLGRETKKKVYNGKSTLHSTSTFTYDADKNIKLEHTIYEDKNTPVSPKKKYKYDDRENVVEEIWMKENGDVSEANTFKYKYDKQGNWTEKRHYRNDELVEVSFRAIEYY